MAYNVFLAGTVYPLTLKPLTHPDNKETYQDVFNLTNSIRNVLSERVISAIESQKVLVDGTSQVDFTLTETLYLGEQLGFEIIYKTATSANHSLRVLLNDDAVMAGYTANINGTANSTATVADIGTSWSGTQRVYGTITPTADVTMIDAVVPWTQSRGSSRCTSQTLTTPITKISFLSTSTFDKDSVFSLHRIVPWRVPFDG